MRIRNLEGPVLGDHTFRLDDVPPGRYLLTIKWNFEASRYQRPMLVAMATRDVVVPEVPGGVTDEPLDVGQLAPLKVAELRAGGAIPALELKGLDGKELRMNLHGRYLLIEAWGANSREYLPGPGVAAAWAKHKDDPKFALLGIDYDGTPAAGRKYVEAKGIAWPNAFGSATPQMSLCFPKTKEPLAWLIGPDGKVIAAKLEDNEIQSAIDKVLNSP